MVLFVVHLKVIDRASGRVSARAYLGVSPYVLHTWEKIRLRGSFLSLSKFTHVSRSVGGRITPSARAYFLSPLKISPETGGHRLVLSLVVVVIYVKKDIAYKSAAFDAAGHLGHEVREVKPSSKVSDERFAHGNRFTDCMVTNRVTLLL